jgi:hypothetical protein
LIDWRDKRVKHRSGAVEDVPIHLPPLHLFSVKMDSGYNIIYIMMALILKSRQQRRHPVSVFHDNIGSVPFYPISLSL